MWYGSGRGTTRCSMLCMWSSDSSLLPVGILRRRHQHAPKPRHPQQHQPFQRIGDVVHVGDVGQRLLEREIGRGDPEQLGIGEALELDAERAAHRAARAVGGDHVTARDLDRPGRGAGRHRHAVVVLADRRHLMAEADLGAFGAQLLFEKPHQLPLLALHAVGVVGVAGEQREIEGRDRAGLAVAELPGRRLQPDLDHARHELELVEQVERRRMEGRAAQLHDQLRLGREQHGLRMPRRCSASAAVRPTGPAPTTMTRSFSFGIEDALSVTAQT